MASADPALRLLGIAARAGHVVPGTERVREAVRAGAVHYVLVADDAARHARDKLIPALERQGTPFGMAYRRWELGGAVGRGALSAVGIRDAGLAARLKELVPAAPARAAGADSERDAADRSGSKRRRER